MKVPLSWLSDYVELRMPHEELASRLAVSSCEVERIYRRGVADVDGNLGLYRVGRVAEAGKHPNADRLQLCLVDVGEAEPRQIVCGAWNFGAGDTVAVALPGALLPDGRMLERAKLRGSVSDGMILSERELELGQDHSGILVLDGVHAAEPGTPLADVLPLGDDVLEVEVTGNRPDLMSIYGIARDVAVLFRLELAPPPGAEPERAAEEPVDVAVEDEEGCPRYIARLFRDVRIGPSPPWLRARLVGAGMRPISNVVDVTNYVMLGLGNPLHAFDHTKLAEGRIIVRRARAGEKIRTLDGTERELDAADLLITDGARPVGLAGIMGSEDSEVEATTTTVLLEAANFEPVGILQSSERLRLRTEGSNRWEKGVDPYLAAQAAALATELIVELTGARYAGAVDLFPKPPPPPLISLRPQRVDAVVGIPTPLDEQHELLERLGFEVRDDWNVWTPTWRARDVTREIDLVEEVARFRLDDIPATLPPRRELAGRLTHEQRLRRLVEDVLVGAGLSEAYTPSLVPDDPEAHALRLPDPLSAEHAMLRTTLREGLVESARRNLNVGNERPSLFEIARVYLPAGEGLPTERWHVGGIVAGDFFAAKGVVQTLLRGLKVDPNLSPAGDAPQPGLELPGGHIEALPDALLGEPFGYFELDLDTLAASVPERVQYVDVVTYPAVKQDLALVVDTGVPAGELVEAACEAAGPELRRAEIFDVYVGEQIPPGKKSVAVALEFQSPERTLSDEDAAMLRRKIVHALAERFGAELR
jgi:phenylalanyl-tRNA synthetase beta chain